MSLPSASTRLSSQAGVAPVSTDLIAVWAPCVTNADGVPRQYSATSAALDEHGYCEGIEYGALHIQDTKKPFLFVPLPIGTAGSLGRQDSVHTGTSKVTIAAGSDGVLAEVDGVLTVIRGGTVGTDQILLGLSLDGETTTKTIRVGTATSYTIPNVGLVVSLGAGTLEDDDTILEFTTTAPIFDADGIATGLAAMQAQQRQVRSWIFVGDVPNLALGQAIENAVNAYETSTERYVYAKFQARDRRAPRSSALRVAMVGTPTLTFAEVGATGDTITRDTGSWVTDGFTAGDYVRVTGSVSNNVSGKITAVTATVLTFDTTDLSAETLDTATTAGVRVTAEPSVVIAGAGPSTLTRNRGSWVADGFAVGDEITADGSTYYTVTGVTSSVLTVSDSVANSTNGLVSVELYGEESETDWMADIEDEFDAIDGSERVDIGAGRLTKLSPITKFTMRRPVQWADSIRSYQRDLSKTTWEKDYGPLLGWGIDGEHDERVNEGLLSGKFTCARTWANGPTGAFICQSLTRATDGDVLGMTHNLAVASLVQTIVQRRTEGFVGATLQLDPVTGFATRDALAKLAAKVNGDLKRNSKSSVPGDIARWSSATWTPATDDVLNVPGATLTGTCVLNVNGTIFSVVTTVEVS
jgi:hypothetical protein